MGFSLILWTHASTVAWRLQQGLLWQSWWSLLPAQLNQRHTNPASIPHRWSGAVLPTFSTVCPSPSSTHHIWSLLILSLNLPLTDMWFSPCPKVSGLPRKHRNFRILGWFLGPPWHRHLRRAYTGRSRTSRPLPCYQWLCNCCYWLAVFEQLLGYVNFRDHTKL